MRLISRKIASYLVAGSLTAAALSLPVSANAGSYASEIYEDEPSAGLMLADALMVRPFMLVGTAATTATFIVTLPFTALGGNVGEAADILVLEPAKYTFVRPLGDI